MKEILVEKVNLNIGTGGPGEKLEKATKLLEKVSGSKPVATKTLKRIPTWDIRPGLEIGCKVTLRRKKAEELLRKLLSAVNNKLPSSKFDDHGTVSFGISEYLNIPGIQYDASIGIIGLEVAVTLMRRGYRIKRRKIQTKKIPPRHNIKKEEAIDFFKNKFNVKVE